ncbi:MAG: hypothetical protein ACUVRZ_04805 [Desulfobacca sp.]|uniref:hypothetical protein n=1 Tax=Desulfobacca sp. TaxID=2067990 RepID=UPI00404B95D3
MGGELIELEKNAGYQAILTHLQEYTRKIRDIQEKYALSNRDIMSPRLIDNPKLTQEELAALADLKLRLDAIINEVAARVEKHRVASYDEYTQRYELNAYDRLRVHALVSSVRDINKSIQKIKFTVENFSRCNRYIINELDQCLDQGEISKGRLLVLGNILLIYELANYMINFLQDFRLDGIDEILELSQKEVAKIDATMATLQQLKTDAESPAIEPQVRDRILANLRDREEALISFRQEWEKYLAGITDVQTKVGSLKDKIPTLQLIRANAQNQLDFYEIVKIFGIMVVAETVRQSLETMESVALPLDELELISLPPHRVQKLMGLTQAAGTTQTG